jgi:cell division protein FtsL
MLRILNVAAVLALLGSAVYAYSIKYDTILYTEQIAKTKHAIKKERDAIGMLRAEWAHLTRPERIQALADKHLDLQPMQLSQIVRADRLPEKGGKVDSIGRKLEMLGLSEPTNTPNDDQPRGRTPSGGGAR